MLIPTGHEQLQGRRWPWITIAIIALNVLVFAFTHWRLEDESIGLATVKVRILMLAANFRGVQMDPEVRKFVGHFKETNAKLFAEMGRGDRQVDSQWDAEMRNYEPAQADNEMGALTTEWENLKRDSILEKFAFSAGKKDIITYVTASFLHGGWFHIIFNMWFLWLAGTVLEDAWGRAIYPAFYLLAGAVALFAQGAAHPESIGPVIGASGAVAGLMGAFLVRHSKTKIQFVLIYFWGLFPRFYKFKAPAYAMLPLWLLTQVLWAYLEHQGFGDGVAYWAHIGGFVFGVAVAVILKVTGVEHAVDKSIEAEVGWSADPRIVKAGEMLASNPNGAIAELEQVIKEKPDAVDAYNLLEKAYWQKQDHEARRNVLATLCRLQIKHKEMENAWQTYEEFANAGGEKFPGAEWMQLCRWLEGQQNWERAAGEYEKFSHTNPDDRMAVYSLVAAARIQLKNLNNRMDAARLYREAADSPVPHLDWDDAIKRGLREATAEPKPAT